jgi:hypothetical protein
MARPPPVVDLIRSGRWDEAHRLAQADGSAAGSWLHGILHLIEGDEENARYWYRRAGRACPGVDAAERELTGWEAEARA